MSDNVNTNLLIVVMRSDGEEATAHFIAVTQSDLVAIRGQETRPILIPPHSNHHIRAGSDVRINVIVGNNTQYVLFEVQGVSTEVAL